MADMPGESQEEPSVMVIAMTCDDPINLVVSDVVQTVPGCSVALVAQHEPRTTNNPSDLLVEIDRVKVLLRCRVL